MARDARRWAPWLAPCVCLLLSGPLLLRHPLPGGDEVYFADPAVSLVREGHMGTPLLGPVVPGMGERTYWQPPFYFLCLAGVFRLLGVGLLQARLLSFVAGLATLLLVFSTINRMTGSTRVALLAALLTAASFLFLRRGRVARMDMLAIALAVAAFRCYWGMSNEKRSTLWAGLTGMFCGLAVMTHPMGALASVVVGVHWLATKRMQCFVRHETWWLIAPTVVLLGLWAGYIGQDVASFKLQMAGQLARKGGGRSILHQFAVTRMHIPAHAAYCGGILYTCFRALRLRSQPHAFVALWAGIFFVGAVWARENYFCYWIPGAAVALALQTHDLVQRGWLARLASYVLIMVVAGNGIAASAQKLYVYQFRYRTELDYDAFCRRVVDQLPSGATVFLAPTSPSPYFTLRNSPRSFRLYSWAPIQVPGGDYQRAFGESDYAIASVPGQAFDWVPGFRELIDERGHQIADLRAGPPPPDGYQCTIWELQH